MQILVKADTILYYSYDFILTFANQLMPLILHQRKRNFYRYMNTPTLTEKLLSLDLSKPIVHSLKRFSTRLTLSRNFCSNRFCFMPRIRNSERNTDLRI